MQFAVNVPLNSLSFGQVSFNLLYEYYKMGLNPSIFSESDHPIDFSVYDFEQEFINWLNHNFKETPSRHNRQIPTIRLWHINGSLKSFSDKQVLLTFHETDQLTKEERNILKSSVCCVSSKSSQLTFSDNGIDSTLVHLGFDSRHFKRTEKKYFDDDRITFNLCGKFEKRKHHEKIIKAWVKKFGNNKKYSLQCSIHNPFYQDINELKSAFARALSGASVFNVNFLPSMPKNSIYNDYLNSADIIIGMSGGEGWGLPEFQSVALGKHAVILNASAYKEWANKENATLVNPCGKIEIYDGKFFQSGAPFNQGNIFDFNDDEFVSACETAILKSEKNKINEEGLKLQDQFKYSATANKLLSLL